MNDGIKAPGTLEERVERLEIIVGAMGRIMHGTPIDNDDEKEFISKAKIICDVLFLDISNQMIKAWRKP